MFRQYGIINFLVICLRKYSKKPRIGKGVAAIAKVRELDVEKDVEKLVKYCCINYITTEEPIKLKPDSEYPEWLFTLDTRKRKRPLSEMDPNSFSYWRRVRKENRIALNKLAALDGWHKKEHRSCENYLQRFYGDLYLAASKWDESKTK